MIDRDQSSGRIYAVGQAGEAALRTEAAGYGITHRGRGPEGLAEEVGHVVCVVCEVVVHRDVWNRPPVNLVLDVVAGNGLHIKRAHDVR